jgi:hypothetical protein
MKVKSKKSKNVLTASAPKGTLDNESKSVTDLKADPHDFDYEPSTRLRSFIDDALTRPVPDDISKSEVVREAQQTLQKMMEEEQKDHLHLSYEQVEQLHKCLQRILSTYDLYFYQCIEICRKTAKPQSKVSRVSVFG